ncbi:MAG: PHB depolymerase family esterase [Bacteroidota bacterium]
MRIKSGVKLLFFLLFPSLSFGIQNEPSIFEKHQFIRGKDSLPYRLLQPKNPKAGKTYPLVIFLHGSGERGSDNEKQLANGVFLFADSLEKYPAYVIVPQCPAGRRWVEADWTLPFPVQPEQISISLSLVIQLTDSLMNSLPIDSKRIYLTGLSMGGKGSLDLAYRYPDKFAAVVAVCGSADVKIARIIKDIPLWAFHGDQDPVVPFAADDRLIAALQASGGKPKFTVLRGVGHNAWDYAYKDPEVLRWMFSH